MVLKIKKDAYYIEQSVQGTNSEVSKDCHFTTNANPTRKALNSKMHESQGFINRTKHQ